MADKNLPPKKGPAKRDERDDFFDRTSTRTGPVVKRRFGDTRAFDDIRTMPNVRPPETDEWGGNEDRLVGVSGLPERSEPKTTQLPDGLALKDLPLVLPEVVQGKHGKGLRDRNLTKALKLARGNPELATFLSGAYQHAIKENALGERFYLYRPIMRNLRVTHHTIPGLFETAAKKPAPKRRFRK